MEPFWNLLQVCKPCSIPFVFVLHVCLLCVYSCLFTWRWGRYKGIEVRGSSSVYPPQRGPGKESYVTLTQQFLGQGSASRVLESPAVPLIRGLALDPEDSGRYHSVAGLRCPPSSQGELVKRGSTSHPCKLWT